MFCKFLVRTKVQFLMFFYYIWKLSAHLLLFTKEIFKGKVLILCSQNASKWLLVFFSVSIYTSGPQNVLKIFPEDLLADFYPQTQERCV